MHLGKCKFVWWNREAMQLRNGIKEVLLIYVQCTAAWIEYEIRKYGVTFLVVSPSTQSPCQGTISDWMSHYLIVHRGWSRLPQKNFVSRTRKFLSGSKLVTQKLQLINPQTQNNSILPSKKSHFQLFLACLQTVERNFQQPFIADPERSEYWMSLYELNTSDDYLSDHSMTSPPEQCW